MYPIILLLLNINCVSCFFFLLTGEKVTAGIGCYIRPEKCPSDPSLNHMFYDGEGATNFATGTCTYTFKEAYEMVLSVPYIVNLLIFAVANFRGC